MRSPLANLTSLRAFPVGVLLLLLFPLLLHADWITLKDGVQVHGKILRQSKKEVTLRSEAGAVLSFRMRDVATIRRTTPPRERPIPKPPKTDDDTDDPAVIVSRGQAPASGLKSVRRPVIGGTLLIPEGFERLEKVRPLDPSAPPPTVVEPNKRVMVFREGSTRAELRVGPCRDPLQCGSIEELERSLRALLVDETRIALTAWEIRKVAGRPAIHAEWSSPGPAGRTKHVGEWILLAPGSVHTIRVVVPDEAFRAAAFRYRSIPASFQRVEAGDRKGKPTPEKPPGRRTG